MSTDTELAWAAGFFDGEGHVSIAKPKPRQRGRAVCRVNQICREELDRFQRAVGVGVVSGPYGPYSGNRRPQWCWIANTVEEIGRVASLLRPYLCSRKLADFDRVFAALEEGVRF